MTEAQVSALIDQALLAAARELGVPAHQHGNCIETGFDHFHLHPVNSRVVGKEGVKVLVMIEAEVVLKDPMGYGGIIRHIVVGSATHLNGAIQEAARVLMLDLMPPLCRLFGAEYGPQEGTLRVSSYTEGDAQATEWEGYVGPIQVFGDENLRAALTPGTPYGLMHQTLTNYLGDKRLHWVKVFGVRHESGETEFTVAIDNEVDGQGNAEAQHKFDWTPFPHPCSFRQFFVIRPVGSVALEQNEELSQAVQNFGVDTTPREEPPSPAAKPGRKWFQFGRKH